MSLTMSQESTNTTMKESSQLPDFERPPVTEVALGIQFEPIAQLSPPILGLYWNHVRHKFPNVLQQPALLSTVERIGTRPEAGLPVQVQLIQTMPSPRLLYIDAQQREMIQVQQDRFVRNWRKLSPEDIYPRYQKRMLPEYRKEFNAFKQFLASEGIETPHVVQCEINYVNQIVAGEGWQTHRDIAKVFTIANLTEFGDQQVTFEDGRLYFRYEIKREGSFVGRLHIVIEPGYQLNTNMPVFSATLTARGQPLSDDEEGMYGFLNLGHEAIVKTFASITTEQMQKVWRRTNGNYKSSTIH